MTYIDPTTVTAPKHIWELTSVILNTGRGDGVQPGFSICTGLWNKKPAVGIRWNGEDGEPGPGNPQSRGHATWFVLPSELEGAALSVANRLNEERNAISCEVSRPEGYDPGAWKVKVALSDAVQQLHGKDVSFPLPKVSGEMCRGDQGYTTVGSGADGLTIWGRFVDGVWHGHYYVYGLSSGNDAAAERIRQLMVETIATHFFDSREPNIDPRR